MAKTFFSVIKGKGGALALMLALASASGGAIAQDLTVGWSPRSGDVWVDTWLGDMNGYGSRYREPFVDELVRYYDAPRPLVLDLLDNRHWAPGDVYYACAIASVLGRPCRYVVDIYDADRGQGWGVIAQRLGIKPGSPEFHRLKKGFVPTYDRWARPIDLDSDLRRDFPDRGKSHVHGTVHGKPAADHGPAKGGKKGETHGPASNSGKKGASHPGKGGTHGADANRGKGGGNKKGGKGHGKG